MKEGSGHEPRVRDGRCERVEGVGRKWESTGRGFRGPFTSIYERLYFTWD